MNNETFILSISVFGSSGSFLAIFIRICGIIKLDMTEPIILVTINTIAAINIQPIWCSLSIATLYDINTANGSLYNALKNCIISFTIYHHIAAEAAITTIAFNILTITNGRLIRGLRAIGI